ncbi:MAG: hypothetical protein ACE5I5_19965 [Candidatus Heimdallarchaeota archaeon]
MTFQQPPEKLSEQSPPVKGVQVAITRDEFFRAVEIWEYLEVEGLEKEFLHKAWHTWLRTLPPPVVTGVMTPRRLEEFFQRWEFYKFYRENVRYEIGRDIVGKKEYEFIMKKLNPGECWFPYPSEIYCKLIGEDQKYYLIERISSRGSNQAKVAKGTVLQLEALLRAHPAKSFTMKQVRKIEWIPGDLLNAVRVLVCQWKARLDFNSFTRGFSFQIELD